MRKKLLPVVGNSAAGNGSLDHKCVLDFSASPGWPRARRTTATTSKNATPRKRRTSGPRAARSGRDAKSILPVQPDQLALDAHAVGRQDANFVSGIGGLERDGGATAA